MPRKCLGICASPISCIHQPPARQRDFDISGCGAAEVGGGVSANATAARGRDADRPEALIGRAIHYAQITGNGVSASQYEEAEFSCEREGFRGVHCSGECYGGGILFFPAGGRPGSHCFW